MENQLASKIPTTKIMQNYKIPKKSTLKSIVIVPKRSEETHQIQHYPGSSKSKFSSYQRIKGPKSNTEYYPRSQNKRSASPNYARYPKKQVCGMSTMGSITSIAIQVKPHVRESATQTETIKQPNSKINPKIRKCYFCKGPHKVRDCELSKLTQKQVRIYQDAEPSRQEEKGNKNENQALPEEQENRGYLHFQEDSGPGVQEAADLPMQLEEGEDLLELNVNFSDYEDFNLDDLHGHEMDLVF